MWGNMHSRKAVSSADCGKRNSLKVVDESAKYIGLLNRKRQSKEHMVEFKLNQQPYEGEHKTERQLDQRVCSLSGGEAIGISRTGGSNKISRGSRLSRRNGS